MKSLPITPVGLLSLMALPAVLYFSTNDRSYLHFLIFLIFLPYFGLKADECFLDHVKRAAMYAFFAEMIVFSLLFLIFTLASGPSANLIDAVTRISFLLAYCIFAASLTIFEWRELKGVREE